MDRRLPTCGRHWFVAIIFLAAALRVFDLPGESFWLDEASIVLEVERDSFAEMARESQRTMRGTPPMHHYFLYAWARIFGTGEIAMRFPSAVAGMATVALMGRLLGWGTGGLIAALLLALNATHIGFSQEARTYAFYVAFATWSSTAYLEWMKPRGPRDTDKRLGLKYVVATAGLLYTHMFAVFIVVAQNLTAIIEWRKRRLELRRWIALQFGVLALLVPWVGAMIRQVMMEFEAETAHSFIPPPDWKTLPVIFRQFSGGDLFLDGLPSLGIFVAGVTVAIFAWTRMASGGTDDQSEPAHGLLMRYLVAWIAILVGGPLILSLVLTPLLSDARYVLPAMIPWIALGALGLQSLPARARHATVIALLGLQIGALYFYYRDIQREDWREVGQILMGRPGPILVCADYIVHPLKIYVTPDRPLWPLKASSDPQVIEEQWALHAEVARTPSPIWLVLSHDHDNGNAYRDLLHQGRQLESDYHFPAIDLFYFGPSPPMPAPHTLSTSP